jgi:hypothetical protein
MLRSRRRTLYDYTRWQGPAHMGALHFLRASNQLSLRYRDRGFAAFPGIGAMSDGKCVWCGSPLPDRYYRWARRDGGRDSYCIKCIIEAKPWQNATDADETDLESTSTLKD